MSRNFYFQNIWKKFIQKFKPVQNDLFAFFTLKLLNIYVTPPDAAKCGWVCVCVRPRVSCANGVVYCRRPFVSTFGRRHTNFVPTFQPPSFRTGLPTVAVTLYLVPAFRPPSFVTTFFITEIFWALVVASPLRRLLESQSSPSGLGPVRLLDRPANQAAISRPPPRTA